MSSCKLGLCAHHLLKAMSEAFDVAAITKQQRSRKPHHIALRGVTDNPVHTSIAICFASRKGSRSVQQETLFPGRR